MNDVLINRMAVDLGVTRYSYETEYQFACRVIYSGISCWIKTVSLDIPTIREKDSLGVSKKHISKRVHSVLDGIIDGDLQLHDWFFSDESADPISLIRERLINCHQLLNSGFDTNVILCPYEEKGLFPGINVVSGTLLSNKTMYSGVSTLSVSSSDSRTPPVAEYDKCWIDRYIAEIIWSKDCPNEQSLQFFDPYGKSLNNYDLWVDYTPKSVEDIFLAREKAKYGTDDYYVLNRERNLCFRINDIGITKKDYIRLMLSLRKIANNPAYIRVSQYADCVFVGLNCRLPIDEELLLEAYAWPKNSAFDELAWIMPSEVWEFIRLAVSSLGIDVMEENNG